eukprot:1349252-Amorphochlora_amoeboformis.AAC.1
MGTIPKPRNSRGKITLTVDVSCVGHSVGEADLPPWKMSIAYTRSLKEGTILESPGALKSP